MNHTEIEHLLKSADHTYRDKELSLIPFDDLIQFMIFQQVKLNKNGESLEERIDTFIENVDDMENTIDSVKYEMRDLKSDIEKLK